MNRLILLVISCIVFCGLSAQNVRIAYYPFNGNANDENGFDLHGLAQNSVDFTASDRFGNPNGAIYIGSNSAYVRIPHSTLLDLQMHTIVAWVKRDLGLDTGGHGGIFSNGKEIDHYAMVASETAVKHWVNYPESINAGHAIDTALLADEEYHFIGVSFDGLTRKIWLDGQLASEMAFSENIDYSVEEDCFIGMDFPGGNDWFSGSIDEVSIYNYALNETDIFDLYSKVSSVEVNVNDTVMIFPNPIENSLVISKDGYSEKCTLIVYNYLGQPVFSKIIEGPDAICDMSLMESGTYCVLMKNMKGEVILSRVVLKK